MDWAAVWLDIVGGLLIAGAIAAWVPRAAKYARGYAKLYVDHVNQAHEGADFDFLVGGSGPAVETDSH